VLANILPRSGEITGFVLSDISGGRPLIMFQDTTDVWGVSSGSVTIKIDGNPSSLGRVKPIQNATCSSCRWPAHLAR
jgi:hypothetical protein